MQFTLQLKEKKDGQFRASCDELGLSVIDTNPETAISRLQELIFEDSFGSLDDMDLDFSQSPISMQAAIDLPQYVILKNNDKIKTFYLPRHSSVH